MPFGRLAIRCESGVNPMNGYSALLREDAASGFGVAFAAIARLRR
jgi:hypothetical protein